MRSRPRSVRSCVLVAVLAVVSALLVPLGSPPTSARAAEPETLAYEPQVNTWSDIYRLVDGVVAVDVGTPAVVSHWTPSGWVEVFRTATASSVRTTMTDVVVVGDTAIDGKGNVRGLPVGWTRVSPYGWLHESGTYTRFSDGATTELPASPGGVLTSDGKYLVRTENDEIVRYDLVTAERMLLHPADPTAHVLTQLVGGGGRVWWWVRQTTPSKVCSVPLDGSGGPTCFVATEAMHTCLAQALHNPVDPVVLRRTADNALCVRSVGDQRFQMIRFGDQGSAVVELPNDVTVQRRQVANGSGVAFVLAGGDGQVRLVVADPRTGTLTSMAAIERRRAPELAGVVVDGDIIYTRYRTPESYWDEELVWQRRLGETAATAGSFVARARGFAAAGGRYTYSTFLPRTMDNDARGVVVDTDRSTIRVVPWFIREMSGGYQQIDGGGQVITLDGRAAPGEPSYGPFEGSRQLVSSGGSGRTLVDKDRRLPSVSVPSSLDGVFQVRGAWVQGRAGTWNVRTGRTVPGSGHLGDDIRVATDGTWTNLVSGAVARWLPPETLVAGIVAVAGRNVVWVDKSYIVRSTTIPAVVLAPPRLLGSPDTGTLDLSTSVPWSMSLDVTKAVAAGNVEIWDGATLVRSLPTRVSPTGALGVVSWDGRRSNGATVVSGIYRWVLRASAVDGSGTVRQGDGSGDAGGWITVRHSPVDPPIWRYYHGGSISQQTQLFLGEQVTQTRCGLPDNGCEIVFANGTVTWNSRTLGGYVIGGIRQVWTKHGGVSGRIGYPEQSESCGDHYRGYGCLQMFSGAMIGWTPRAGAHPVWGAIGRTYRFGFWGSAGPGIIGLPITDERCGLVRWGCYQIFTHGHIHYSPATGAHWSIGAIREKWASYGWERSRIGYPKTDESCDLINDNRTCTQTFEGARIIWTQRSGAHPVWGAIRERYRAFGGETGIQWTYPTTDERCGLVRSGCYQIFNDFHIHWSPRTGAHITSGAVRNKWASLSWERGRLGYPTSELTPLARSRYVQYFEGGAITLDSYGRASVSYK